ncbi:UDP-N-acetylmuramoyl-tripeptide--D-alanyl-D-alanine ligase [Marinibactrum halimedae]|uniref:UDP-N-acetylmuramoyl-tripeptide--D-alanyl-D-alanine ligase n=1 Tax=Marinibactrum halimedae TaxID=1444977 RepID=A0AA37WMW0_9GAMM|nr:UDP-N-acetylmuramoyl-tripeptide--D-alanyl-D-alanine ligase [Marinibactrum halimedae]MCD9459601.1 UDP-N-acetylmuramoyl-tripeptide--D-alanyl-D-alanine ligase [Marinibactrum halimedae]GLS25581.1 UDP-N-acetylmuramoyl-tripeptide--D-alanyl-D-alanine ligase [Marinibactrum halimedae]
MIRPITLLELSTVLQGRLLAPEVVDSTEVASKTVTGVSTDTRAIESGNAFVAITGEHFDGHQYVNVAAEKGAVVAIVSEHQSTCSLPQILVDNTVEAYGKIAQWHRRQWPHALVAITGSCGKTTVKTLLASIFRQCGETLATEGNFNNHIGVPKTLLNLCEHHEFAVVEMGASAGGEIGYLVNLAEPQVAMVNNVVPAHMEGFGSVDAIAVAKGQIYDGLSDDGIAVVNLDDHYAGQWLEKLGEKSWLGFSLEDSKAHFYANDIELDEMGRPTFQLMGVAGRARVKLPLLGSQNVANALAAAACAHAIGASLEAIVKGLETVSEVKGRLSVLPGLSGAEVIDDAYNANPGSVKAAVDVLSEFKKRRIFVLGDMGELGDQAEEMHREVGRHALEVGISQLFTVGELTAFTAQEFGSESTHFDDQTTLITALKEQLSEDVVVLVKGSRSAQMDAVVQAITSSEGN